MASLLDIDFEYVAPHAEASSVFATEEIVKAASGNAGGWGTATGHNITNGARASGNVTSAHSLLRDADLDWDPEFAPLFAAGLEVSGDVGRAVVRSDNKRAIGVVGSRYTLIPHRRLADLADALCGTANGDLHYGNAGHKQNGARPFIQLKSAPRRVGLDTRSRAVEVSDVITLMTGHDGTLQTLGCYGSNIIVCDNTYGHALDCAKSRGVSIRHTASAETILNEAIRMARFATEQGAKFDNAALQLMVTPFGDVDMQKLSCVLIPGETTRAFAARAKMLDAWANSPGAAPGSAWGAAQAVTYFTSHSMTVRGETDRAFGLATGEGSGSELQASAWYHLTTDEGAAALEQVQIIRRAL
jgi:uncharacterized protein DUF932